MEESERDKLLSAHPFLHDDAAPMVWQEWLRQAGNETQTKLAGPKISDANVHLEAACDGYGLTMADDLASIEIAESRLIRPFPEELLGYGYAIRTTNATPLATAFRDFIKEEAGIRQT